jgi:ribonucleoside-diphosphate reductase alpha chain
MLQQEGTFVSSLPNPDLVEQSYFKFPNALSQFVTTRSYLRWMDSEGRREDYPEAVARYVGFISKHRNIPLEILSSIQKSMLQMGVLPSMRALWSAGPAAERDNTMIYNCSFVPLDSLRSFSELLYILMMGTGVGYSVESQFVENLPEVSPRSGERIPYVIEDSTEGWANAFFDGLTLMWKGHTVDFDYSKIREAGARCNTKGGRASGPEPLRRLLDFSQKLLDKASGRKLYDIEASDIACMVGEIVMAGGVRRAALICFSDPASERMRFVKKFPTCLECGHGWDNHLSDEGRGGHLLSAHGMTEEEYLQKHPDAYIGFPACRFMANVSGFWGVDPEKGSARPPQEVFWAEWEALKNSGSGERGFFMFPLSKQKERRGDCRSNPCGEILLRYSKSQDPWTGEGGGGQFCNLSAAVMRAEDTRESFAEKVRTATWIGAIQSTFTFFPYLRPAWKKHCDEDRLLGVDITGHCDNPNLSGDAEAMSYFNQVALETAAEAAAWLNIPMPAAITCGKPSGNSSQAVDCSSGFHPRYSPYYVRRVRISAKDPLFHLVRDSGAPVHKETKWRNAPDEECPTWVVEFPVAAPEGAMTRNDETALQQLERYLQVMQTWCSKRGHNQSATIYVRDNEWQEVGQWVWDHFDQITGLSFLPHSDFKYALAPYEEIDQAEYESRLRDFPRVDYSALSLYEKMDEGEGAQNLACVGGVCEI